MAGKYALELDDTHAGWLVGAGGGYLDVDPWIRRKEGVFGLHPGAHRGLWAWVDGSPYGERRGGAIIGFDAEGRESERLVFSGATVAELGMPALGASVGDLNAGALSLRLHIGAAAVRGGGRAAADGRGDAVAIASCRLRLSGAGARRVDKIDALTIKTGPGRRPHTALQRVVLGIDAGGDAGPPWDEALVGSEGSLEYLAPDATTVLARVDLRVEGVRAELMAGAASTGRTRVELACRGLRFALEPATGRD